MLTVWAILIGFVLDLLFGDPLWLPHPVVTMGKAISWYEKKIRPLFKSTPSAQMVSGGILAIGLPLLAAALSFVILYICYLVHPLLYLVVQSFQCYQILSAHELWRQSLVVEQALDKSLDEGRNAVSRIVGRDVSELDETGVRKATIETVAENTSDGVIAPLLYMMIGGAPLAMLYKAVNTLDSTIGYKNDTYLYFGRVAARFDDILNYLPARISALCAVIAAPIVRLSFQDAFRVWRRDRRNHASPNSAQTESAFAGALGIQLAGNATYFGELHQKPTIGDSTRPIVARDILRADQLMMAASVIALAGYGLIRTLFVLLG